MWADTEPRCMLRAGAQISEAMLMPFRYGLDVCRRPARETEIAGVNLSSRLPAVTVVPCNLEPFKRQKSLT